MQKTSPEIAELKHRIEKNMNRKMKTPNDFIFLSGAIFERTRETMSPTTLKRLWCYLPSSEKPRTSTLDLLAQFVGYHDWQDFCRQVSDVHPGETDTDVADTGVVNTPSLQPSPQLGEALLPLHPSRPCRG